MKKTVNNNETTRQIMLDGLMTIGMMEDGLRTADFMCCEDVEMTAFSGTFKVQGMRDGNVYMTEKKKRIRNRPLFREDNSSLSKGADGNYYFYFMLPEEELRNLPKKLVNQAYAISQKVMKELITIE